MSDKRNKIEARLRKWYDDDLKEAVSGMDSGALSELVRDGLRIMLGIRTKSMAEIKQRPLAIPQASDSRPTQRQAVAEPIPGTGKGWINPKQSVKQS